MPIPKRIIQTHRDPQIHAEYRKTWIDRNPGFEYLFFDDNGCTHFIKQHYPEYLSTYEKLPRKAQKADFFRYMAIHYHGGVYADVDTLCKESLSSYLDLDAASLIVGIEMSADIYRHSTRKYLQEYIAPRQFAQWAFAACAGHPMLAALLLAIHRAVLQLSERQLAELSTSSRFVLELTGPIAFTQAMRFYMAFQPGQPVQVLPQLYWGYSPWHNAEVNPNQHPEVKLVHLFHGSWRNP
jgi:mannosyltransferase OCH1-like enzyme